MLRIFRIVALWEAISTLCLFFIAMPMKYIFKVPEATKVAGSIHGGFVFVFVILLIMCTSEYKWPITKAIRLFLTSLVPIYGFKVELDLKKEIEGKTKKKIG